MSTTLSEAISKVTGIEPGVVQGQLSQPKDRAHGDLAFACFPLAKVWGANPVECAKRLAESLVLPSGIKSATVIGPYLNFRYDRASFAKSTLEPLLDPKGLLAQRPSNSRKIIIEFSSPNIAKTFHVGHLRTTLIGHSLVQIYKHLGFEVIGINHLGDWGTQFGFVYAGCKLWGQPKNATVEGLVELYQKATTLRKAQEAEKVPPEDADKPAVNQMARDYFIRLESGEKDALEFWQWCLDISLDYFKEMYRRLGIEFDHYTGESFYRGMLPQVESELKSSGCLEDSEGALGVDLGKELGFARVFAPDGRSLYITRDIAAAQYREKHFNPEAILYVVAAQQSLHFKQLKGILERAKYPVATKIRHISFGFVPGMSTREGGAISLKDFLNEAHSRALQTYRSEVAKRPAGVDEEEVAEKVAIGATYFYFLSHSNIKDFQFSWDVALNFQGDTGPYLQYAVARINSIEGKAGISEDTSFNPELLVEDSALELLLSLSKVNSVLEKARIDNEPYYIAHYLIEVAKNFSRAYNELNVVGAAQDAACSRLALFRATRYVLETGLGLLGVPVIERM